MTTSRGEAHRRIEKEIAGEKAAALGRAGERLERALRETEDAAARLLTARDGDERERRSEEYTAARRRALDARLALLIQREALGLRRHTIVDQQFPEPPDVGSLLARHRTGFPGQTSE